jgi:hypothetical protein
MSTSRTTGPAAGRAVLSIEASGTARSIRPEADPYQPIRNAGDGVDGWLSLEPTLLVSAYFIQEFR